MSTYHLKIKSGKKGSAFPHAGYITRRNQASDDLIYQCHGNLPTFAHGNPNQFFRQADKYERANGAAYREYELALPNELETSDHLGMLQEFIEAEIGDKAYLLAIHEPNASLSGVKQPHAHLMFCDRKPDHIVRNAQQFFKRHNPRRPETGGAKKDRSGRTPIELREQILLTRARWAEIQNKYLQNAGFSTLVDHRSLAERGIDRAPERHLGKFQIMQMTEEEIAEYLAQRDE